MPAVRLTTKTWAIDGTTPRRLLENDSALLMLGEGSLLRILVGSFGNEQLVLNYNPWIKLL